MTLPGSSSLAPDPVWVPNLSWLSEDLAVGGRVPAERVPQLANELRIGAVVDLRQEESDDAAAMAKHGIAFLHLPTVDHGALRPADLEAGVAFAREAAARTRRLLVHCEHGIGRSATLALAIMVDRGADPLGALAAAKDARSLLSPSPAQYEGWADWLRARGTVAPDFERFAAIAYRHLA